MTEQPKKVSEILVLRGRLQETPSQILVQEIAPYRTVIWVDADSGEATMVKSNTGMTLTQKDLS
jgi:hypothetical protein